MAVDLVTERPVQFDRGEIPRAHLKPHPGGTSGLRDALRGPHHRRREPVPPLRRHDGDGEHAAHARLEQQHDHSGQAAARVLDEDDRVRVTEDPPQLAALEPSRAEARVLDPDEVPEVSQVAESEQRGGTARIRLVSFAERERVI